MNVEVEHLGAAQFEIKVRQHVIISDQPVENGGFDEGVTPPELLLASLGSCAAYYAAQYLRKNRLAKQGTRVSVSAQKAKDPVRLDAFVVEVETPADLSDEQRAAVEKAVHGCLIHATLLNPPRIRLEIKDMAKSAAQRAATAADTIQQS